MAHFGRYNQLPAAVVPGAMLPISLLRDDEGNIIPPQPESLTKTLKEVCDFLKALSMPSNSKLNAHDVELNMMYQYAAEQDRKQWYPAQSPDSRMILHDYRNYGPIWARKMARVAVAEYHDDLCALEGGYEVLKELLVLAGMSIVDAVQDRK